MPVTTIHGDQLRDKSVSSEKLDIADDTIPQSAIIGLSEAWDEVYAVLGTDHEGNGIVLTTDINPFVNILETRQIFVKGTAQSLLDTLGIPFIHVYLDDTLSAQITPYQFSNGYYLNIPSDVVVGQKIKLSIVAIDSLSRKSHPRDLWISIVDRELEKPTIKYLYKRMSATYPGIDFFKDLYFQVSNLDSQGLKDIFGVLDPILAAVYVELYWDKNDISTIFYKGQCYDGTDTVVKNILASLQNNAVFYARVQLKEKTSNIYSPWSNFQKFQYIVKTDTQCSTVYTASKADTISKTSMYAIDAYGPGSGCVIDKADLPGSGGCHAYKNELLMKENDTVAVIIGAAGVSYHWRYNSFQGGTLTTCGTNTSAVVGGSVNFSMVAHSGDGWKYPNTKVSPSENFVPVKYQHWKGIPGIKSGRGGGRDGFLFHPVIDGDRGSLNDCGVGGTITVGRGNIDSGSATSKTVNGGGYVVPGNTTTSGTTPWVGGAYYNGGAGAPWGGSGTPGVNAFWQYDSGKAGFVGNCGSSGISAGAPCLGEGYGNGYGGKGGLNIPTQINAGAGLVILVDLALDEIVEVTR